MKTSVDKLLEDVEWVKCDPPNDNPDNLPYPTHSGVLRIADIELECHVLNTGQRIFAGAVIERLVNGIINES